MSSFSLAREELLAWQNGKARAPPAEPLPARRPRAGEASIAGDGPARTVHFQVQLQIVPEPRMTLGPAATVQILEAVDELGHSLLPTVRDDAPAFGAIGMTRIGMGATATVTAQLHRPETPGKLIKTLRGTVDVFVSAPRPNPLVIPLEGAVSKTFQNDDRRVVVNSIDTDPVTMQTVIELMIDDLDELFPAGLLNGSGPGAPLARMARRASNATGGRRVAVADPGRHLDRPERPLPGDDRSGFRSRDPDNSPDASDE